MDGTWSPRGVGAASRPCLLLSALSEPQLPVGPPPVCHVLLSSAVQLRCPAPSSSTSAPAERDVGPHGRCPRLSSAGRPHQQVESRHTFCSDRFPVDRLTRLQEKAPWGPVLLGGASLPPHGVSLGPPAPGTFSPACPQGPKIQTKVSSHRATGLNVGQLTPPGPPA